MIFSKRQVQSLTEAGVLQKIVFLENRTSLKAFLTYRKEAKRLIHDFDCQLVHSHYGTLTSMFASFLGRPMLITFQGSDINYTPSDGMLRDFFGRLLSNITTLFATKIICVSDKVKEMVWWGKSKCVIIPIGVNPDVFFPQDRDACREQLGWKKDEFIVLFNANNPSIKRIDIAQDAMKRVREMGMDHARLEVMSGFVDAGIVPAMINASDCVLLCSDNEGSPTIVKEAMACNKAIVSNDVGDVTLRLAGVTQTYIVKKEAQAIAEKLSELASMPFIPASNGRENLIQQGLTDTQTTIKVKEVYQEMISKVS